LIVLKRLLPWLLVFLMLAMAGTAGAKNVPDDFTDIQGHWAEQDIKLVSGLGLMNGTETNEQGLRLFSPDEIVTRAQLAAVLQYTFQLDYGQIKFIKPPLASDYYPDVDNQAWYANSLVMCAINNIFPASDSFYPDRPVTRLETAQAICRCFDAKGISVPMILMMPMFEDTGFLSQEELNAVVFVNNTGIMKGEDNCFRPEQNVTRAELAGILSRCIQLLTVDESLNSQTYPVQAGQTFIVALKSNPTTGYTWNIKNAGNEKVISLLDTAYVNDASDNQPAIVGQGGRQYWYFKALQAGTTELQMVYARPWESVQPAQVFDLKVTVNEPSSSPPSVIITNKVVKSDSDNMSFDLNIPVITGWADQELQSSLNARFEQEALDLQDMLKAEMESYVKYNQENGFPIRPYELVTRYQECYQNDTLLSLYVDYYQYTGGAHGMTDRRSYNIDLQTGKDVALTDLFQSSYDYQKVVNTKIKEQIAAQPDVYFTGDMGFKGISDNQSYYLQDGFLVVYFSQYQIAPYATGIPEFKIPLTELQGGIRTDLF
jgi:predicted secreted protein